MPEPYPSVNFHERRRGGLGGSDAGPVLGVEGAFKTELAVALEKRGDVEPEDIGHLNRIRFGNAFEPAIADWYRDETGWAVHLHDPEYVEDPTDPLFRCHPDGLALTSTGVRLLELKTADKANAREWKEHGPPLTYVVQVQHNLMVCLADGVISDPVADLVCLFGGNDPRIFHVEYDPDFAAAWRRRGRDWWDRVVLGGDLPAPTADDLDVVKRWFPLENGKQVHLPGEFDELDRDLVKTKAEQERAKLRRDELEARLRAAIGEASVGVLPSGVAYTLKTTKRAGYTVDACEYRQLRRKGA